MDIVLSCTTLYLFVKPLNALSKSANTIISEKDNFMKVLMVRYTILTFVAILSTFLVVLLTAITRIVFLGILDTVVKSYMSLYVVFGCISSAT